MFIFMQTVAYNTQPNDQMCISTEGSIYEAACPHCNGLFQPLLSSVTQVHCVASVFLATSWDEVL